MALDANIHHRRYVDQRRSPSLMLINTVMAMDLMASASKRTTYPNSAPYFSAL